MSRVTTQTLLAFSLAIIITLIAVVVDLLTPFKITSEIISGLASAVLAYLLAYIVRTFNKNATTLTFSVLGLPSTGKTVYLTILFDVVQSNEYTEISFSPYGEETIEQVHHDLNMLFSGEWLKPTRPDTVNYYRANVTIGVGSFGLTSKRYKVEIADYAGEHIDEFNPTHERWLHKTSYFRYVTESEGVFLALDADFLLRASKSQIEIVQNAYVSALQVMIEKKGVPENRKMQTPVAVILLKSDLLPRVEIVSDDNKTSKHRIHKHKHKDTSEIKSRIPESEYSLKLDESLKTEVFQKIPRLLRVLEKRCKNLQIFFISSTGGGDKEKPPKQIRPSNVSDAIIWMIKMKSRA